MKRKDMGKWLVGFGVSVAIAGCTFYARSPEQYRDDTTNLLASKAADLDSCYDNALKANPSAAGRVTVVFTVEQKTGKIADAKADPARTTATSPLADCVINAINGLVLAPPDQRKGSATFEYDFAPPPPAAAAAAAPAAPAAS